MNSSDKLNNEMLTAYFDGELSQAEQLQVEQALFDNPAYSRQLRNWAVLRDALQQASHVIDARVTDAANRMNSTEPQEPEAMVMKRISAAMAAGEVKWAPGSSGGAMQLTHELTATSTDSMAEMHRSSQTGDLESTVTASGTGRGHSNNAPRAGWMTDYRRLNPSQRLRRWQWQLGVLSTLAAGLMLTVYWSQNPRLSRVALKSPQSDRASVEKTSDLGLGQHARSTMAEAMARMNPEQASGPADDVGDNPLLAELKPGAMMSTMSGASNPDSTPLYEYTTFMSYDVADPELGLKQMQSVLEKNSMTPIDIFEQDDSPVVVLSGDAKKLAEVLESFQAAGDNSLTLIAKVGPEFESPEGTALNQFGGSLMTEVSPMNSFAENFSAPGRAAEMVAGSLESRHGEAQQAEAAEPNMIAQDLRPGPDGSPTQTPPVSKMETESALVQAPGDAGDVSGNVMSFSNYRQDIIRSQANVFNSLISPSKILTLEEFLNERPTPKRARVPFGWASNQIDQGIATNSEQSFANPVLQAQQPSATDSQSVARTTDPAVVADQSVNGSRGNDTMANRKAASSMPGGVADQGPAPGTAVPAEPFNQRGQNPAASEPPSVMAKQSEADGTPISAPVSAQISAPQKQVVVILRPKARTQQSP